MGDPLSGIVTRRSGRRLAVLVGASVKLAVLWILLPVLAWPFAAGLVVGARALAAYLFLALVTAPILVGIALPRDGTVADAPWILAAIPLVAYALLAGALFVGAGPFVDRATGRPAAEVLPLLDHIAVVMVLRRLLLTPFSGAFLVLVEVVAYAGLAVGVRVPRPWAVARHRRRD